jgi:hypothetical protein
MEYLLKERELDNSSKPYQIRQPARKNTAIKERATHSFSGRRCIRELMNSVMMMSENQLRGSQSQVHVAAFWGTEG